MLTSKQRTINFIEGKPVDHIPFHPLVMQYAAQKTGTLFGDYCLDPVAQCNCMLDFARKFGMDSSHPSGFPYCEAGAYGLEVTYPADNLPYAKKHLIEDFESDVHLIRPLEIEKSEAMMNRVRGVALYKALADDEIFINGHCEGPFAEYCDLRGVTDGFMDLCDYEEELKDVFRVLVDNIKNWIALQVDAGCHCMSIGEAVCSQISEEMYLDLIYPFHKEMIEYTRSLGVYVRFHICGDSSRIVPHLIKAGVNIMDVDFLVKDIAKFIPLLGDKQVLCGNIDPVSVIKNGTPEGIDAAVKHLIAITNNKCIIAAGCEIPKDTPEENYKAFLDAVKKYSPKQ